MSHFDKNERDAKKERETLGATPEEIGQVLSIEEAVEDSFEALELDQQELFDLKKKLSPDEYNKTITKIQDDASQATFATLAEVGVSSELIDPDIDSMPPGRVKREAAIEKKLRRRIIAFFSTFTQGVADQAADLSQELTEEQLEKQVSEKIQSASSQTGILQLVGTVAESIGKFFSKGESAQTNVDSQKKFQAEYKFITLELARRLNYVKKLLKHNGGAGVGAELKIAMSFTTLIPFALVGEMRRKFDLAHKVLWWLARTSRIYIEDRHGGIGEREPQDEILRNEGSSFPLAAEIPQTDVASILTKKLERYSQNQKEYFIDDGIAHVLVWNKNVPSYIHVPLEWYSQMDVGEVKARIDSLLRKAVSAEQAPLTAQQMEYLRQKAYGKYSEHDEVMKEVFQADLSIVLDAVNIRNPKEVMSQPAFLTAGARMRETLIFQHEDEEDPLSGITGIVNKFAHTHVDGKKARELMLQDLADTATLSEQQGAAVSDFDPGMLVSGLSTEVPNVLAEAVPPQEYYGVAQVDAKRSQFWIQTIGALREWYKKKTPEDPPSFGTADLFCFAQMFASRTTGVHFLESKQAEFPIKNADGTNGTKEVEVLDVAFSVIPEIFLDFFSEFMSRVKTGSEVSWHESAAEAWKNLPFTDQQIAEVRVRLIESIKLFVEEKKRAKGAGSTASFMSTLAGGIKQVEKLMQFVSESDISVGDDIAHAVGNPRGGLVSMLAETRSLPQKQENGINMLWFGSANTDTFTGDTVENWGGVLGVSSSSEGFAFLLRKLQQQVKVSPDYYQQDKSFRESLKPLYGKIPFFKNFTLDMLPKTLADYERATDPEKRIFFGPGTNGILIHADLKKRAEFYAAGLQSNPEEDTQRQAEDVAFAVEFMLHLLASDPEFQASLQS